MDAAESAAGTTFLGDPFTSSLGGRAALNRDIELVDFAVAYVIDERFRVSISAKQTTLEQDGDLSFGADLGVANWSIETTGLEARFELVLTPNIVLGTGWSSEDRDVEYRQGLVPDPSAERLSTQRDGFFLSLSFDPLGPLSFTASVEDNSIDDPFTLSAPTQGRRYRVHGRYRWDNGLGLTASYRKNDLENDLSGWSGDTEQTDIRLSRNGEALRLSAGYGRVDYSRRIDQLVMGGARGNLFSIAYGAEGTFLDASLRWQAGPRIATGAYTRIYDNDGSYPLERNDWRAFVELGLGDGYHLQIAKRSIDYDEDGFDDFDAELVELAVGFRW